jgi:hypothetical protein
MIDGTDSGGVTSLTLVKLSSAVLNAEPLETPAANSSALDIHSSALVIGRRTAVDGSLYHANRTTAFPA